MYVTNHLLNIYFNRINEEPAYKGNDERSQYRDYLSVNIYKDIYRNPLDDKYMQEECEKLSIKLDMPYYNVYYIFLIELAYELFFQNIHKIKLNHTHQPEKRNQDIAQTLIGCVIRKLEENIKEPNQITAMTDVLIKHNRFTNLTISDLIEEYLDLEEYENDPYAYNQALSYIISSVEMNDYGQDVNYIRKILEKRLQKNIPEETKNSILYPSRYCRTKSARK